MITKDTIDKIMDAARIEEVVADFVHLKKRGANYIGLCPFHHEKTPSFTVSQAKGIYKCFGCGKSGNSIGFVMEHEHFTYKEALLFLATKYQIQVEEKQRTTEEIENENVKESLYIVNTFAQNFFSNTLLQEGEGKTIGLSYFIERGVHTSTIEKFKLGYSPSTADAFTTEALKSGYQKNILQQLGLTSQYNQDFFRGRIIFTIHSMSGKVVGFGGRTLSADKKIPKYINSPETEIYTKSKIVYGIFQARKEIVQKDVCYLVEGYMDVISMSQAGIENVVASSGTSLTQDQVRLIKRYTKNLCIIYDGDNAGIKAALRGLEIALEEGMHVKIILLPAEDDPDSYVRKVGMEGFLQYVEKEKKDFIHLKTSLFLKEANEDPVKIAGIIKDIVQTIALIPDAIERSLYIKQTASQLTVEEQILIQEINKILRKKAIHQLDKNDRESAGEELNIPFQPKQEIPTSVSINIESQLEKDIVRLLLENSNFELDGEQAIYRILRNLENVEIENNTYQSIIVEYKEYYQKDEFISQTYFVNHSNPDIQKVCLDILQSPYELSENWSKMHGVHITEKYFLASKDIVKTISALKKVKMEKMRMEVLHKIKELEKEGPESMDEIILYMKEKMEFDKIINKLSEDIGTIINPNH